ncbi:cephalosporin hydroxylase [Candidatus Gracilibacteria bacterium]|nr:cephalosporin hydroxylase [Candidatus Gracilibacteria bacterium]
MKTIDTLVEDESQIEKALQTQKVTAEVIAAQRYSDADKMKFSKIIAEFNAVYYTLSQQTWGNTKWRGVPVCKAPTDLWIYQELIEATKPDLIIETGTLAGGSALFMRDVMHLMGNYGWVISIDTNMEHLHEVAKATGIKYLLGSSADDEILTFVKAHIAAYEAKKVMVVLDSNHEYVHVIKELARYAPLVSVGCALIVEDTNNHPGPRAAADEWFMHHEQDHAYRFRKDYMCEKFMLTFNRDGFFERVK